MTIRRTKMTHYRRYRPAVAIARTHARELAEKWELTEVRDSLEVAVSELVTNSVVHGRAAKGSHVTVTYHLDEDRLRAEVRDWASAMPRINRQSPRGAYATGGRGLQVVAALTDRWGVIPRVIGKSVWFEFRRNSARAEATFGGETS
ncbi:ATP-binding protein [Streptomyces sp. NPDC059863]|uniref:ATP-binding protein n=1 Tax=unclassified Streptomyces TaxID=2593676 RepID=UPI0036554F0A